MILDLDSGELPGSLDTDVCVIGAGAAGITLGLTLARRGVDAVILESGGRSPEPEIQLLNDAEVVGRPYPSIQSSRSRALGGTTTQWGGQILPVHPIDFEPRPWVEGSGWPISYTDLLPYFDAAMAFEGLGRAIAKDADVWRAVGLEPPQFGPGLTPYLSRWCPEPNFASLYGAEIAGAPSLRCILHATVVAISTAGARLASVITKSLSGREARVRANRFIFCLGGIETPRLLLQPLENGTSPPWGASGILGGYFQDHPHRICAEVIPRDRRTMHRLFDQFYLGGFKYQPRMRLSEERQRQTRSLNAGGIVLFQTAKAEILHHARIAGRSILRGILRGSTLKDTAGVALVAGPLVVRQVWRLVVHRRAYNPDDLGFSLGVQVEQPPRPESRISLSTEVDTLGMRRARLNWHLGKAEIDTIAVFAETVKSDFEGSGLAEVRIHSDVAGRTGDVLTGLSEHYHHMGTTRMAESESRGVVDGKLKMFHADNAYVCSTAVFPTSSFSNPTHTLVALALRLADHLCERKPG